MTATVGRKGDRQRWHAPKSLGQRSQSLFSGLIRLEEQPRGSETYSGAAVPGGEWRAVNRGAVRLVNRFEPGQVERALLSWSGKGVHRLTLAVWSKKRTLAPGESLRLDAGYEPR